MTILLLLPLPSCILRPSLLSGPVILPQAGVPGEVCPLRRPLHTPHRGSSHCPEAAGTHWEPLAAAGRTAQHTSAGRPPHQPHDPMGLPTGRWAQQRLAGAVRERQQRGRDKWQPPRYPCSSGCAAQVGFGEAVRLQCDGSYGDRPRCCKSACGGC